MSMPPATSALRTSSTYNIRFYQGRYVQGVIAGKLSKAGLAGYVGSVPVPEVVQGINAFMLGMQSINPKARMKFVLIDSWYDPPKEGDAAKALMDQGCDIITQHTDSPAPLQAAASRGIKGFGQSTRDPETGVDTTGFHRLMLKDSNRLGVSLHSRRRMWEFHRRAAAKGQNLPVAITLGVHPLHYMGSMTYAYPQNVRKFEIIGGCSTSHTGWRDAAPRISRCRPARRS